MKRILYILVAGIFGLAMSSCVEESFVQYNPEMSLHLFLKPSEVTLIH